LGPAALARRGKNAKFGRHVDRRATPKGRPFLLIRRQKRFEQPALNVRIVHRVPEELASQWQMSVFFRRYSPVSNN
jgi:hypothetical protein